MNTYLKTNLRSASRLIVFFAGWGVSPAVVLPLKLPADTDLLICFDYDGDFSLPPTLSHYQYIEVYAWSMGVWVAERALCGLDFKIDRKTAINGTGLPIHEQYGISPLVFEQTNAGMLSPQAEMVRHKFERRMCVEASTLAYYQSLRTRGTENIAKELAYLYQVACQDQRMDLIAWDKAIVGLGDKIFLPEHQIAYWQTRCPIAQVQAGHYHRLSSWQALEGV